jgi:phosphatidyl-myo-inositol dimannoside synthase
MKIIIFSSEFPPLPGGIGNHACNLAKMLARSGAKVTVLTNYRGRDIQDEDSFDRALSFPVIRIRRYAQALWTYLQRILKGFELLRGKEPATVIASGKFSLWLAAVGSVCFPRHRYFAVIHGSEISAGGRFSKKLTHWSLFRFEQLIAVSNFTKELLSRIDPSLKITVINNGFVPKEVKPGATFAKLEGAPALITVGNVTRRKGQQNVIRALPLLREHYPTIHYHVVGIPTEREAFSKLAESLGVGGHVTFYGQVSDDAMAGLLQGGDIFVMLSEQQADGDVEGFGIAVLEAAHAGLPALGARDSGIQDAIKDRFSGCLVNPQNPREILAAVQDIMASRELFKTRAVEWSEQFKWEIIVKRYIECLKARR